MRLRRAWTVGGCLLLALVLARPAAAQPGLGNPAGWAVVGAGHGNASAAHAAAPGQQGKQPAGQSGAAWLLAASSPAFGDWAQKAVQGRQDACQNGKASSAPGQAIACADRDVLVVRYDGRQVAVDLSLLHGSLRAPLPVEATLYFRALVDVRGTVVLVQPLYTADGAAERPLLEFVSDNLRVAGSGTSTGNLQVFGAATALAGGGVAVTLAGAWASS